MILQYLISIISAAVAVISAYIAYKSYKSNKVLTEQYNKMVEGQLENQLRTSIQSARLKIADFSLDMYTSLNNPNNLLDFEQSNAIFQELLNGYIYDNLLICYEDACSKYLDNKVNKDCFKKTYKTEILRFLNKPEIVPLLKDNESRFPSLIYVYNEWLQEVKKESNKANPII